MGKPSTATTLTVIVGVLALLCSAPALGQEVQTDSYTLPGAASIVEGCTAFTDPTQLLDLLETAGTGGILTDEEAIAILTAAGTLGLDGTDPELASEVEAALVMVLNALNAGIVDPEGAVTALTVAMGEESPLDALAMLLDEQATPPGIRNAIWNAAMRMGDVQTDSGTLFAQIELAVQAGVPPGIVVRVAKDALRSGLDPEAQIALVAALMAEDETSPGQAANGATGKGKGQATASGNSDKPKKDNKGQSKKG
jgi:hypothetical protein